MQKRLSDTLKPWNVEETKVVIIFKGNNNKNTAIKIGLGNNRSECGKYNSFIWRIRSVLIRDDCQR